MSLTDEQRLEETALQIVDALAPLTRRDAWWTTDGPCVAVVETLRRQMRARLSETETREPAD